MKHIREGLFVLAAIGCSTSVVAQATYDARIMDYTGLRYPCGDIAEPVLKIANNGSATMLTCVVETWKNGLQAGSFNWELAVPALQGDVRQPVLPPVGDVVPGDMLEFRIISVNGQPDEESNGNVFEVSLDEDPGSAEGIEVMVEVLTDDAPDETSWSLLDQQGAVVAQGGPYTAPAATEQSSWTLEPASCYQLRVVDAAGDGMPGGHVKLFSNFNEVIAIDGSAFIEEVREGVVTSSVVGMNERRSTEIVVFPNPTPGDVRVVFPDLTVSTGVLMVMDAMGRVVVSEPLKAATLIALDLEHLPPGPYTLAVRSDGGGLFRTTVVRE